MNNLHKKHIIILGPAHPLRGGGMSTFNERMANAFQDAGYRVTIYTFSLQYPSFLFPGTSQYTTEPAPARLTIRILINSVNPFNWIKVGRLLKNEKPELIITRYWIPFMAPCLGTILRIARKNKYSKIVCIADNIIPHEKGIADTILTQYFIKPVDAFLTLSKKVLEDLYKLNSQKPAKQIAHPLYDNFGSAIDLQTARTTIQVPLEGTLLLFFGFIRKYKGLDLLLNAMKIVKDSFPIQFPGKPVPKLLIAGEFYEDKKPFFDQAAKLGIEDCLIWRTDFIPNAEVNFYFCAANLLIQPYRNATQSGVTPLAYHFELPMLVTNVAGLPDMVPDGKVGHVCEPDAASIAKGILLFLKNDFHDYKKALAEEKKKYGWDVLVKEIESLAGM